MTKIKTIMLTALIVITGCTPEPEGSSSSETHTDDSLCQFDKGPCLDKESRLTLSPANAPSEKWLSLKLDIPAQETIISAQIAGRDMFMGVIPVTFDSQGSASAMYGSCSSGYMVWRLSVESENENGEIVLRQFDWLADNPEAEPN